MQPEILITRTAPADNVLDEICRCLPPEVEPKKVRQAIIKVFSGQWVYFPHRLMLIERNRELVEQFFKGETRGSLCREFKISRSQLQRIVKRFHKESQRQAKPQK
jgi:Mor family transcriptional regulator